jgi:toxin FitB
VRFLVDTNVISEARKPNADPNVHSWFRSVSGADLYLSVLVLGEIRQGVERLRRRDPTQAGQYDRWLATLRRDYAERLLPVTTEVAQEWGRLNVPYPLPVVDGLLAATALVHGMTLVTRNISDVARSGVLLLNPFEGY